MSVPTPKWRCDLCGAGPEMFGKHRLDCPLRMLDCSDKLAAAGIEEARELWNQRKGASTQGGTGE